MTKSQPPINEGQNRRIKRLEISFWLLAIGLGFLHAWSERHELMNADAMSYLDMAEAYLRRDWGTAINAYWSPLYSWLIALALLIAKPSPYWKFAVVHLVNFAIYIFALGCFGFLIRQMVHLHRRQSSELLAAGFAPLRGRALISLGYSLFIWSTLFLILVKVESPDLLVASFVYLATGLILRIHRQPVNWLWFALLGLALGFGYLAKSVMLPMALVFLAISLFSNGSVRQALPRVAVAFVLFVLVAGPYVFAISREKGRLTFGDSGKLNYLWAINRVTAPHWQGDEPGSGKPAHPTRKILDSPPTYEFDGPVGGTYPVWYDPTYWYEGSVSHFDFRQQLRVFVAVARAYYELFHKWGLQYGLLVGLLSLYLIDRKGWSILKDLAQQWRLLVPALAGAGMYAFVNVQGRYVASFIVLMWLGLFSAIRLPDTSDCQRFMRSITIVLVAVIVFTSVASSSGEAVLTASHLVAGEDSSAHEQWQVAEGLREMGIDRGDKVAVIGNSFRAFWAHLLGARIVAEVRRQSSADFWEIDTTQRNEVIKAFDGTAAKAIVAEEPPSSANLEGWQKIRATNYYVYLLEK